MKIKVEEIEPMGVQTFVTEKNPRRDRQPGFNELTRYRLDDLDVNVLSELCNDYRARVFDYAGKDDPQLAD